jgi:UDP-4-amino-4,6-dideoxy-N-acetyl-beta-L-altrosamine transaminase
MIPYGHQDVRQSDIDAVVAVLRSDFLTQGPAVPSFEAAISRRVGARNAVAVSNGTAALHVAALAFGLKPGGLLWTVPNTFVASANCARYCGAEVDFVDIDAHTWNISVSALADKLVHAKRMDRLPDVVVPVHFAGQPTEQEAIWQLAQEYGFKVLEDASHSIGATRNGEAVGSCRWSHITVLSFHPVKIITTGEGGMALTNDDELAERMRLFRNHGITRDSLRFTSVGAQEGQAPSWHYEQQVLGFNYRMTDIHAALGLSQLQRLDEYVARRNSLAKGYDARLEKLAIQLPTVLDGNLSAFHLYVVRVKNAEKRKTRRALVDGLRARGISPNVHYAPVHLQPYYRQLGFTAGQFPQAELHGESALTLPLYATLTEYDQDRVSRALEEAM